MDIARKSAIPKELPKKWDGASHDLQQLVKKYGLKLVAGCHLALIREASDEHLAKVLKRFLKRYKTIKSFLVDFHFADSGEEVLYSVYLDIESGSEEVLEISSACEKAAYTYWPEYLQSTPSFYFEWDEVDMTKRTLVTIDRTTE